MSLKTRLADFSYRTAALVAAGGLLVVAGCGGNTDIAPVRGTVLLDGKPLDHGMVMFVPDAGRGAKGAIQSDGSFVLGTLGESDGALIGPHRVAVTAFEKPAWPPNYDQDNNKSSTSPVPTRYNSADSSGLTFEVKKGSNTATIELQSK